MELIIGAILGVLVGLYIGNDKARKWTNDHLFKSKKKKKQEPEKKQEEESKPWSW
jgi:uncharacterized membrane-anchored protein